MPIQCALPIGQRFGRLVLGFSMVTLALALATPALAQVPQGRGRLQGQVFDSAGNPIGGAQVKLTFVATGDSWTVVTKKDGRWLKGNMGRGTWNLDITAEGFLPSAQSARVQEYTQNKPVETILQPGDANAEAGAPGAAGLFSGKLGEKMKAGNALYDAGDYPGALAAFEAILAEEHAKDNPIEFLHFVDVNAGNAAFEARDYDTATAHFEAAVAADPENTQAHLGLAKVAMMQRDLDSAIAHLAKVDPADISDPIVFYNIGSLFFDQGQSAEAQKYYELAIQRDPGFADAHMQVGLCLIQQGKMDEAKPHLEKVIELDPGTQNAALAQNFLDTIG